MVPAEKKKGSPMEKDAVPQEVRELRYRNRQLNKTMAKQGITIHVLRSELAEVRELNSKAERGELRRLERVTQEQAEEINRLTEKLDAVDPHDEDGNRLTPA